MTDTQTNIKPPYEGWQPVYIKKVRGVGFWIAVGLASFFFLCTLSLFVLFIGSLVISKAFVTGSTTEEKKHVYETVVEGSSENKVAIISIKGILSNESAESLFIEKPSIVEIVKQQLEQAAGDTNVKAVLFEVDSPGGGITASDIIYNQITKFKTEKKKGCCLYAGRSSFRWLLHFFRR